VACDQAVAFSPERVGEHFVRDAVEGVVELLVSATAVRELDNQGERPPSGKRSDQTCELRVRGSGCALHGSVNLYASVAAYCFGDTK